MALLLVLIIEGCSSTPHHASCVVRRSRPHAQAHALHFPAFRWNGHEEEVIGSELGDGLADFCESPLLDVASIIVTHDMSNRSDY